MNDEQKLIWDAIYEALHRVGNGDVRAGLPWITHEQAAEVVATVRKAVRHSTGTTYALPADWGF